MSALSGGTDRRLAGGVTRFLPSASSATPYEGSLLSINSSGYYAALTAGQPFAGICERTIQSKDAAASNGQVMLQARTGLFRFVAIISGLTAADVVARRRVYASTDNDLSLTAEAGNTYVGRICDLYTQFGGITNGVVIEAETFQSQAEADVGSFTLADAAATLTVSQLDQVLYMPNTAARTLTLPAVASCTGRRFTVVKTTAAAFAVTLQGNASENINGANTYATSSSQYAVAEIRSDGTQWILVSKI